MSISFHVTPGQAISGDMTVPGDKSISHRAIILSSLRDDVTYVTNILLSDDVYASIHAMRALGVSIDIDEEKKSARIIGVGLHGLKPPGNPINCGNSGTTMRLLCGLLAAQSFDSQLIGDDSLMRRPMLRIVEPLLQMGAQITLANNKTAPLFISGGAKLRSIHYESHIPSAQVKSGILLASLYASGKTTIHEKIRTRDHTERMLNYSGDIHVPGDISSAAFFIVLAAITPGADLIIRRMGVNPFRTGIIDILTQMGADIVLLNQTRFGLEPIADIHIRYAPLHGISIPESYIATAIDEFPAILVAASTAQGETLLRNAAELRVKESDRITSMVENFKIVGVNIQEFSDGLSITGVQTIQGGSVNSFGDHRIAMTWGIAGNIAQHNLIVQDCTTVSTSFPDFVAMAKRIGLRIQINDTR